jgi:hypothetical protein
MNLSRVLLFVLVIIGVVMIYLGVTANMMKPPILSGVGFLIIAYILGQGKK